MHIEMLAVSGHDAGGFLSAMLQRIEAKISQIRRFFVAIDAEDGALVVELVGADEWEILCRS